MYHASQMGLFGDEEQPVKVSYRRKRIVEGIKRLIKGRQPHQYALKIKTRIRPRKIEHKPRVREDASLGNNHVWTDQAKLRIHQEMIRDWEERFNVCSFRDQVDYWTWMLADEEGEFSFRLCLIATGFRNPDQVIEAMYNRRPAWYRVLEMLPEAGHLTWLTALNAITDQSSRSRAA